MAIGDAVDQDNFDKMDSVRKSSTGTYWYKEDLAGAYSNFFYSTYKNGYKTTEDKAGVRPVMYAGSTGLCTPYAVANSYDAGLAYFKDKVAQQKN